MLEKYLKCSLRKLINDYKKKDRYNGEGKFNQNPENKANNIDGKINKIDKKFDMWRKKSTQIIQQKNPDKKDEILERKQSRNFANVFSRNKIKLTGK